MLRRIFQPISAALLISILAACGGSGEPPPRVFNRLVVIVDSSGSYASRQAEAIEKVNELLLGVSNVPRRYFQNSDEVVVITLDALPEVIYRGNAANLGAVNVDEWTRRFSARSDFTSCTDVDAALELAVRELRAGPAPTNAYIYAFSDLLAEEPLNTLRECAPRRSIPGDGFDWNALQTTLLPDADAARTPHFVAFWMPAEQKRAWDSALATRGFPAAAYRLFSDSESATGQIDVPAPAERQITAADKERARGQLMSGLGTTGIVIGGLLAAAVLFAMIASALQRRRRSRNPRPPRRGAPRSSGNPHRRQTR